MDVTCDRCGTEYEFEEALVSTRGTTVKCTHCGHLFKVYKPESAAEPSASNNPWTVRRNDGSIHRLSSLADLTRLIEDGAFGREDEVSRTSRAWKRLGDIEELDIYFARSNVTSTRVRQRRSTGAPQLGVRKGPPAPPPDAAARSGDNTIVGRLSPVAPGSVAAAPAASAAVNTGMAATASAAGGASAAPSNGPVVHTSGTPASANAANGSPAPQPSAASTPGRGLPPATEDKSSVKPVPVRTPSNGVPAAKAAAASPIREPAGDTSETDPTTVHTPQVELQSPLPDPYEPFARRKAPGWLWLFVIGATVAAFASWLLWPEFEKHGSPAEAAKQDPAIQFLARADAAFATHREQRFEEALTDYVKALAFHENDPHVLSSISRVYGVWAQELVTRGESLSKEAGANQDVERRSQLLALGKQARELGEQAKRYAENAARKNPGNEEAEVALSDALRLTGNLVSARSELDRARTTESSPSGETLRVAALLAIAEARGDLRAGLPLASQAVAQDPELIRARLLLARCLVADGDVQGARYHLAAVATKDRSHPGVAAIEQELTRVKSPNDTPSPDSGLVKDNDETSSAGSARADKDKDKDKDRDKDSEGSFDNLSHEAYIARGQKMLESGQVTNAKRMFEQALFIRPSSSEAHAGLGFVALEKGRTKLAVEHFQEAKRDGNGEALIGLGEAYRRLNRPREALRAYQSYVTEYPRGPQIGIARAQVDRLTEEASAGKK
jgi:predicted Zn finger-like uncharacterized protein